MHPGNIKCLIRDLQEENWYCLDGVEGIDKMFSAFNDCLDYHLNLNCPFKKIKSKQKQKGNSWVTQEILSQREQLKFYYSIFRTTRNENFKLFFKNYRKNYRKNVKAAKAKEIEETLMKSQNFPKTAWGIINNETKANNKQSNIGKIRLGDKVIVEPSEIAREFNNFFSQVAISENNPKAFPQPSRGPVASMVLTPVTESEVARVIQGLNSKKSCDTNGMSAWLLKQCYRPLLKPLVKLINCSFASGRFPNILKVAKVTPVFKKDDPCLTSNYRPISILPVLSKVFEKTFLERLDVFFEKHNIISDTQFGFRKRKSTIDACTKLVEMVVDGLERREHVLSIFLDLSKAFDCVHHVTLLRQLEAYGVRGLPLEWLTSYLNNRTQYVQIDHIRSEVVEMKYGVPQGSILGPVLFLIYVNSLSSPIHNGKVVQYADDTTLCIKSKTMNDLEIDSYQMLNSCIQYFSECNLQTNKSKSNFIKFCLVQKEDEVLPTVMIDDALLENADSLKFLGMNLDRGLTWDDHINKTCTKVTAGIYVLRNLAQLCSPEVLKMAYYGLIYPHLVYGIRLWGGCAANKFERVFRLQKRAIRVISKLNSRESCRVAFRELNILTLPCIYVLETALYCRFKTDLVQGRDVHQYETRGRENFRGVQHRSAAFDRLPAQVGVKLLNKLPDCVTSTENQKVFKNQLKHLLVTKVFYSVGEFMESRWE